MTELIKTYSHKKLGQVVDARLLYQKLEVRTEFSHWIKRRALSSEFFVENKDWAKVVKSELDQNAQNALFSNKDYVLTIDAAKKIAMMERTQIGNKYREYFITLEKKAGKPMTIAENVLHQAQLLVNHENRLRLLEANADQTNGYLTIAGWHSIKRIGIGLKEASRLGRKATKVCNNMGIKIEQVRDPRFGLVNSYPEKVLDEILYLVKQFNN